LMRPFALFLVGRDAPRFALFPYTTLFRSIRARSRATEPVAVALPGLTGFTIVGSREVTEVALEGVGGPLRTMTRELRLKTQRPGDRKSIRLNSSHVAISYAVFCLIKKIPN